MRLVALLAALVLVLALAAAGMKATTSSHPHAGPTVTPSNAGGIVNQARSQLQRNESAGQSQLQRGLQQAGQP